MKGRGSGHALTPLLPVWVSGSPETLFFFFLQRLVLPGLLFVIFSASAPAAELEDFFGRWKGAAIIEQVSESGDFQYSSRDLDVTIRPATQGFSITWTSEKRAADGLLERRSGNRSFFRSGGELFESEMRLRKGLSFQRSWARLTKNSLIIYVLEVDERGVYELSRYMRRLISPEKMTLGYTRDLDGRLVRAITGELARVPD